jgi:NitT/TauT family transport system ATP-binding protein
MNRSVRRHDLSAAAPPPGDSVGATVNFQDVRRVYKDGSQTVIALDGIDLTIRPSSFFTILGPSGCGKSTLLNRVAGFDRPTSGQIDVDGRPVGKPSAQRAVVFQDSAALFPWLTVAQNVAFGLKSTGRKAAECRELVADSLELVRLSAFADRYPHQLSGGMRQLVAISRVLVLEPKLLLMDEPFAALDAITRLHLQERLAEIWQRTQITVLFITHSVDEAIMLSDEVAVMSRRPGTIRARLKIDLPRPRSVTSTSFNALKEEALGLLTYSHGIESDLP